MKEVQLKSGATLKISVAPFSDAKALYQAILEEFKQVQLDMKDMHGSENLLKNLLCIGFSSKKIEAALDQCFKRCIYNSGNGDFKIDKNTFEPMEAREDYIQVCIEVAKENILPFLKSLMLEYSNLAAMTAAKVRA